MNYSRQVPKKVEPTSLIGVGLNFAWKPAGIEHGSEARWLTGRALFSRNIAYKQPAF